MTEIFIKIVIYINAFIILWYASGLIFDGVKHLSKQIKMSSFATSFFVLGILTSIPEFSVGINAIIDKQPSIFVGNLIGATLAIFAFVIPLLAIFGREIHLKHQLPKPKLMLSIFTAFLPVCFVLDGKLNYIEALIAVILYTVLFFSVEKKKHMGEQIISIFVQERRSWVKSFLKILIGAIIVFVVSNVIVNYTIYFSGVIGLSSYIVSLLILGIGTNLPEISVAVRSILNRQEMYAFGDYVGSAASNTLFFGILILLNGGFNIIGDHFYLTFFAYLIIFLSFYFFVEKDNRLSRKEGFILLTMYLLFLFAETLL